MLSRVLRPSAAVRRAVQYQVVRGFAEPVGTRPIPKVPGSEKSAVRDHFSCYVFTFENHIHLFLSYSVAV